MLALVYINHIHLLFPTITYILSTRVNVYIPYNQLVTSPTRARNKRTKSVISKFQPDKSSERVMS